MWKGKEGREEAAIINEAFLMSSCCFWLMHRGHVGIFAAEATSTSSTKTKSAMRIGT
jgi:hypothetical protein